MRYRAWGAVLLVIGLLTAGCRDTAAPVGNGTLSFENQSDVGTNVFLTEVYFRPCGSSDLGPNRLEDPLGPTESAQWELPAGCYVFSFVSTPGDEESPAIQVQIEEGKTKELGVRIEVTTVTM